jgi:hypothetical protein
MNLLFLDNRSWWEKGNILKEIGVEGRHRFHGGTRYGKMLLTDHAKRLSLE